MADFRQILDECSESMRAVVSEAVGSGAELFKKSLRSKTPASRTKTRRYTTSIHRKGDLRAVAGVIFPANSRYETSGTDTRQRVEQVYREESKAILEHIASQIGSAVGNQPSTKIEIRKG
jgi:hypothetical protein